MTSRPAASARGFARSVLAVGALAVLLGTTSCSSLTFVKRRLPPPTQGPDGITFRFEAPSARVVQLMGNWPENNWGAGQAQTGSFRIGEMTRDADGIWTRVEKLKPGRYQYKFKIDDTTWKEDPNNPQKVDDGYGGNNSLLNVE